MQISKFLIDSEETGRFIVKSLTTGKTYFVEPIGNKHPSDWGDLNPATGKIEGSYGKKYTGCVTEKESIIASDNGFTNIVNLGVGVSPICEIEKIDRQYEKRM